VAFVLSFSCHLLLSLASEGERGTLDLYCAEFVTVLPQKEARMSLTSSRTKGLIRMGAYCMREENGRSCCCREAEGGEEKSKERS